MNRSPPPSHLLAADRLVGIDLARALALAGMMAVHILPSRDPEGGATISYAIFGGRSSALFAVLAGVSLGLISGRTQPPEGRQRWALTGGVLARALVLVLVGFGLGSLGSPVAVILVHYGLIFALGTLFLGLSARHLFPLAAVWVVAAPATSHLIRSRLDEAPISVPTLGSLADPVSLLVDLGLTGYYPVFPWLAYLLVGLAIGRLHLRSPRAAGWLVGGGVALASAAWLLSAWLLAVLGGSDRVVQPLPVQFHGVTPTDSWWYLAVALPHSATPLDLAHTIGTSLAVIGLALLLTRHRAMFWAVIGGAGAMSLSVYSLHVIGLASEIGPGEPGQLYLLHLAILFTLAAIWRITAGKGPLESMTAEFSDAVRRRIAEEPAPRKLPIG